MEEQELQSWASRAAGTAGHRGGKEGETAGYGSSAVAQMPFSSTDSICAPLNPPPPQFCMLLLIFSLAPPPPPLRFSFSSGPDSVVVLKHQET